MNEWSRHVLGKGDKLYLDSTDQAADSGCPAISLAARNTLGKFLDAAKAINVEKWWLAATDSGFDLDLVVGMVRYSIQIKSAGAYEWHSYIDQKEVFGGGENSLTDAGVTLIFYDPPYAGAD
jgi:hypothetical protein